MKKNSYIRIRLTEEEKTKAKQQAKANNTTLSMYVRMLLFENTNGGVINGN